MPGTTEQETDFEVYEEPTLGIQDDGEPAVATEDPKKEPEDQPKDDPETSEGEDHEGEDPEGGEKPREKKKSGSQRARERVQRLETEVQFLREQLAGKKPAGDEPQRPAPTGAPKEEDFDSHDDYLVAKAKFELRQEAQHEQMQQTARQAQEAWEKKVEAGREQFEDWDEVLEDAAAPSAVLGPVMLHEKTSPEVIYYLATHPKELKEINALRDPYEVAEAMADVKAKVKAAKASKEAKPTTKAPAPPKPVKGSATAVRDDDGFEAY